jgi:general secretion pathway protein D
MSLTLFRTALCVAVAGVFCASAPAQKNELLDRKVLENKVAAQKLEREVSDALEECRTLARTEPAKGVGILKAVLAKVEKDEALSQDRRDSLIKTLKAKIVIYENDLSRPADTRAAKGDSRRAEEEAKAAQDRAIQKTLQTIAQLKKEGRTVEAARMADDLARRYPNNSATQATGTSTSRAETIAANTDIKGQSSFRFNGVMVAIDRSKLPPVGDVEFDVKHWRELVTKRKGLNEPVLTKKEQEIMKSLAKAISVDYDKANFKDVIQHLTDQLGCEIVVDQNALNDALVTSETQISLKVGKVSGRTVLRKILGELGLAYVIKNDVIQVVSKEQAEKMMVKRTYYLGDLLSGGQFAQAGIRFNPGLDMLQAQQNVISIMGLIQSSVDPDSWEAAGKGGKGTISFYGPLMAIIVVNSAEVHGMMGGYIK